MIKFLGRLVQALRELRNLGRYAAILEAKSIARRMFVTNSFDGLLSSLGVLLGSYIAGEESIGSYIGAIIGASFSLGFFSGFVATFLSERAERLRELRRTEQAMARPLSDTIYGKAARAVPLYVSIWSGIGAAVLPAVGASPLLLARLGILTASIRTLVFSSAAVMLAELFLIGVYLGRISGENPLVSGLRTAAIGLAAVALFTLIGIAR
ncbi:MAG: hypothetical protein ABWW70_06310 [Thermoproteota archaeon]